MKALLVRICLLTTLILLMSPQQSYATHVYGGSISYACQNACTYTVYVETHYDCYSAATSLPPAAPLTPTIAFTGSGGSCTQPAPVGGWVLDSYIDVTPICPTDSTNCTAPMAVIQGTIVSIYRRDYDFCGPGACNSYVASWSTCCRGGSLPIGANGSIYASTEIDLSVSPCNSNPEFAFPPVSYVCAGVGSSFSQAAVDADGDSLVYRLVNCKDNGGLPASYSPGYSPTNSMGPSWQVNIDFQTGMLSILPNPGGVNMSVICIQVDEYRSGSLIGSIHREMFILAINCPTANTLPQLDSISVVRGGNEVRSGLFKMALGDSLELMLEVSDANTAQSLDLVLPQHIDGLSKSVIGTNPATILLQFKPTAAGYHQLPLEVRDDACSIMGSRVANLGILVSGKAIPPVQDSIISDAVHAKIWSDGSLFWDPMGGKGLQIPKDSAINIVKAAGLWIGGRDANGQLRLSAHGQDKLDRGVSDFWAGPLTSGTATTDSATVARYNKIWHITQTEIDAFLQDFGDNGIVDFPANYPNVYDWPAFGTDAGGSNVTATNASGQPIYLAPFNDVNGNVTDYNPNQGDHPAIKGDQMYWWIFNDKSPTHDPGAGSIGLEVHASAFVFDCPDSLDKNNSLFFEYVLINRSNLTINNTYLGFWTDAELGNPMDDYIGTDSLLNLYFFYNADADDDNHFGVNPPALGVGLLAGPLADANDGVDNDKDGITDEAGETWAMDGFMSFNKGTSGINGQPTQAIHYDRYLRSFWQDSQPLIDNYLNGQGAGDGYSPQSGSYPIRTMLNGDPCTEDGWTEKNAGMFPGDRQGVGSMGPFTLSAGAVQQTSMHYSWERAFYQDEIGSVCELRFKQRVIQQFHQSGYQTCGYYAPPVHPGDANFDQVANNLDLLAIGLTFGQQGPARIRPSNQWVPQNALDWGDTLANGADYKHANCNGDWKIDTLDIAPILLNYGNTHTFSKTSAVGSPLFMIPPAATYLGGDTARIPIHWGDMADPLTDAYGIAFSITYDSSKVEKSWIAYSPSWFATPGTDMVALDKDLPGAQRIDVGISRSDNMNRAGYGHIADLIIVMDDDLNKRVVPMTLGFENVYAINSLEEEIPVETQDAQINLETAIDYDLQSRISLFPNPTEDKMAISGLRHSELNTALLYDVQGRLLPIDIQEQQGQYIFNLNQLEEGFYLLEIHSKMGKATFKVIKQP